MNYIRQEWPRDKLLLLNLLRGERAGPILGPSQTFAPTAKWGPPRNAILNIHYYYSLTIPHMPSRIKSSSQINPVSLEGEASSVARATTSFTSTKMGQGRPWPSPAPKGQAPQFLDKEPRFYGAWPCGDGGGEGEGGGVGGCKTLVHQLMRLVVKSGGLASTETWCGQMGLVATQLATLFCLFST